ncbi:MAG: hypothetical protein JWN69_1439, partial [Alphaproteobacteria bacterium]|nr:hypothetical protein [Alphaproteobacteria bacterium]
MAKFDGRGLCVALFGLSGMAATAIASTAIAASPAKSGQPLAALSRLEPGLWQIRELNNDRAVPQSICIGDPAMLMQVKHSSAPCSMLVIANEADGATVHYTCPANGYGRTSLRVE